MRVISLFLIAILVGALSCSKPTTTTISPIPGVYSVNYWGEISGTRQGTPLQNPRISAVARVPCTAYSFDIIITEFDDQGEKLTTLTLLNIPKRTCSQTKFKVDYQSLYCGTDTIGSTFRTRSDQLPWGSYKPVINAETVLAIQSFDTLSREIKGIFSIRMVPDILESASAPALLQIKNGKFVTKLAYANGTYKQ